MNILRALLSGLAVTAAVAACGSDSGNSNASKLAACGSGSGSNSSCSGCVQDKCSGAMKKCYGDDFNGGVCQSYSSCVVNAPDPCKPTGCAAPSGDCLTCLQEVSGCVAQNCTNACTSGSGNGAGGSDTGMGGGNNGTGATSSGTGGRNNGTGASGTGAAGQTGGSCADLNTCCGKITQSDLKSACTNAYSQAKGNDSLCSTIYDSLTDFCP